MTVFETGYRGWDGKRTTAASRWMTICLAGIRRAYKSNWLRRLMKAAVLPLLYFAFPLFLFEQSTQDPQMFSGMMQFIRNMPQSQALQERLADTSNMPTAEEVVKIRHDVWGFLFLTLMRYPQAILMVIIITIVAPPLISQDLRTRAYLIYFSRPLTRAEYILGKFCIVGFFVAITCATPPLILWVLGLMLTSDASQILSVWDHPIRIFCATLVVTIPTALVSLAISSLTLESRYAAFAWFAIWMAGHVIFSVLFSTMNIGSSGREAMMMDPGWRTMVSPFQVLGVIQSAIFGFNVAKAQLIMCCVSVTVVSVASLAILFHRVQAPMRA